VRAITSLACLLLATALVGCGLGSQATATLSTVPASVAPSVAASAPASAAPATPSAVPTPGPDAVPTFTAGARVATNAGGLRVRSGPGTSQGVVALLPTGARLVVELGPVRVDGYGWYQVKDADAAAPTFDEGWVAAGFMPTPYLVPATFDLPFNPILGGFANDADGEYGPVRVADANITVRWVASVLPGGSGCSFSVDFVPGAGTAVPAIRATIGKAPAPGSLYGDFFTSHRELIGDLFIRVTSDCSWALTFVRDQPVGG
jgi:Bacterial SH3 domain